MLTGSVNIERYIKTHTTNIKLNAGFVKSSYKNIVNSTPNKVEYKNQNYGIEIRSGFTGIFNYNFGTTWKHNEIVASNSENSFINNESFLDLTFIANKKLDSKLEAERYYLGNLMSKENEYYFLDFDANYKFLENKLTFSLEGKNLFNSQVFRTILLVT